jgi:biopolymer transport protein TolR
MMGMQVGDPKGGVFVEMNVVPLIDILLVLLVIFMIIPHHQKGLDASIPQAATQPGPLPDQTVIVVQVLSNGELRINRDPVGWDELATRLERIYSQRANKVAFIRGEAPVEFALVARVVDVMHGSGISVGLLTPGLEQSR